MKLSYVISTQPTRFAAVSLAENFKATVARLAELGFDGVELAVRDPAALDAQNVKRILAAHKFQVPAIGTGQAFVEEGLSFTDPDESVRGRAVARIESHIALAREFGKGIESPLNPPLAKEAGGIKLPLVILGLIRGTVRPPTAPAEAHAWLVEAMRTIAHSARDSNVRLAIEPINRYETNLLNTVAETLALIDQVGAENIGVLFDTFHANIEEPSIEASLRACGARLFHVHLADSNRWAPGFGHTDFTSIISTLREMKYNGWVSAEILQKPDVNQAMEQTAQALHLLVH